MIRKIWLAAMSALCLLALPAHAQIQTVDPDSAIDSDLGPNANDPYATGPQDSYAPPPQTQNAEPYPAPQDPYTPDAPEPYTPQQATPPANNGVQTYPTGPTPQGTTAAANTYKRDDLIGAAEGVFGKGAQGLAGIIESILADQGEPNAYISGREASGAFIVGLRYGSGIMSHRIEGQRPVYWTGPSVGFDIGGDAAKVFVLVYNLYDTQELYKRFPAAEGRAYFVGGFSAAYLRSGDTVLIPVRLGVGWRLGANVGYMKFSEEQRWLPF